MFRFFKKDKKGIKYTKLETNTLFLAKQFDFLNGNYSILLQNKENGNQLGHWMDTQLDTYLRRFFATNSDRILVLGGRVSCNFQNKQFRSCVGRFYDHADRRNATCLLYFVDSFEELRSIHKETLSYFNEVYASRRITLPTPPVFIITLEQDSPLNNIVKLKQLIDLPVLDSWYLSSPEYVQKQSDSISIKDIAWKKVMGHIESIYFRLAIARGLIHKEVIDAQAEFLLCTNQFNQKGQFCQDAQEIMARYLFNFNVNNSRKKTDDFIIQSSVTYDMTKKL